MAAVTALRPVLPFTHGWLDHAALHAWMLSPPAAPDSFGGLRIEANWSGNIFIAFVVLAVGTAVAFLGLKKAKV
jgi:hypothetical protein